MHHYQHCHHHRVLLVPGGAETANITPPRPSTLSLDCTLNTMCHLDVLMPSASALKCKESDVGDSNETGRLRQARTHTHSQVYKWRENAILPCTSPHTWTRPVPTLKSVTDGANMRDVSGVAKERYLLVRWKPNTVNYTACLPNHFSAREMASQDKLVISQKQSIWKDDALSVVRSHLPALRNEIMAGKWSDSQRLRGDVFMCEGVWRTIQYVSWR